MMMIDNNNSCCSSLSALLTIHPIYYISLELISYHAQVNIKI